MKIKTIIIIFSLILFYSCTESTKPDLNPPTQIEIKSIFHYHHNFVIKWEKSPNTDFYSYDLYQSPSPDMNNEVSVFSSNGVNDTTATITGVAYNSYVYFQLVVTDHSGNKSNSQVIRGSSYPIIVFQSNMDEDDEIYMMNLDGSGLKRLTNSPGYDGWPIFSPDGSKFLFETKRDGNYEIYQYDFITSENKNLTNNPGYDVEPYFTKYGYDIVFISDRSGFRNVHIMSASGTNQTQLTDLEESLRTPVVSPVGDKIAVPSRSNYLFLLNIDGGELDTIAYWRHGGIGTPGFTPDGKYICIANGSGIDMTSEVYIINMDGEQSMYRDSHNPIPDPVENIIYMTEYNNIGLNKLNLITGEITKINKYDDYVRSISSDGSILIISSDQDGNHDIYSMYKDGSNRTNLTNNNSGNWYVQIQPQPLW